MTKHSLIPDAENKRRSNLALISHRRHVDLRVPDCRRYRANTAKEPYWFEERQQICGRCVRVCVQDLLAERRSVISDGVGRDTLRKQVIAVEIQRVEND